MTNWTFIFIKEEEEKNQFQLIFAASRGSHNGDINDSITSASLSVTSNTSSKEGVENSVLIALAWDRKTE